MLLIHFGILNNWDSRENLCTTNSCSLAQNADWSKPGSVTIKITWTDWLTSHKKMLTLLTCFLMYLFIFCARLHMSKNKQSVPFLIISSVKQKCTNDCLKVTEKLGYICGTPNLASSGTCEKCWLITRLM